ncbi:hypothetical protein Tco_1529271, partial [Tanacetum coccineum]
ICQRHVDSDKDPEVSTTSEFFALACGPTWTPISVNSCIVDGVRSSQLLVLVGQDYLKFNSGSDDLVKFQCNFSGNNDPAQPKSINYLRPADGDY